MNVTEFKKDSVYKNLKNDIFQGKYPYNFKLPRELDFAVELGVAKVTLRSALIRLESEGLIARMPGRGTYVIYQAGKPGGKILIIVNEMEKFENPSSYILPGILSRAAETGYETVSSEVGFLKGILPSEQKKFALENNIFGAVVFLNSFIGNEPLLDMLRCMNIPIVLPHGGIHDRRNTGFAVIRNDYKPSWRMAVEHLIAKGHRNIGSVILNTHDLRTYSEEEYLYLLEKCSVRSSKSMIAYSSYSVPDAERAVSQLLADTEFPPTAILCYSDFMAIYVYEALKKMGIRIPQDIAVMGYCGYPGAKFLNPPLSTIDFQYFKAGTASIDILLRFSEWFGRKADAAVPEIIIPHVLEERESTNIKRIEEIFMPAEVV